MKKFKNKKNKFFITKKNELKFNSLPKKERLCYERGWPCYIKCENGNIINCYFDNNKNVELDEKRPCKKCNKYNIGEYDNCIGKLPGVIFACCGHGQEGYITFENGITIRFNAIKSVEKWIKLKNNTYKKIYDKI